LALHLTELSNVFQAGYIDFAVCTGESFRRTVHLLKLYGAAAKSERKANCEKFDSESGELGKLDDLADSCVSSGMAF